MPPASGPDIYTGIELPKQLPNAVKNGSSEFGKISHSLALHSLVSLLPHITQLQHHGTHRTAKDWEVRPPVELMLVAILILILPRPAYCCIVCHLTGCSGVGCSDVKFQCVLFYSIQFLNSEVRKPTNLEFVILTAIWGFEIYRFAQKPWLCSLVQLYNAIVNI